MKNLLLLELKAVFREYRQANKLSWHEMILFLFFFISITTLFYVLKIFAVHQFLILNIILILFILLAVSSKKDYFYDFLQQKKHNILKSYPRHYLLLNLIKGIKYEFIYFLELSVILFFVFLGLIISGQAISAMIPYFIFIGLCAFTARNLSLSLYSLKISSLWYYVSIILKAVFLSANFIILSFILQWAANLQGVLFEELAKIPFIDVITGAIKFLEKNIVSFPLILAMFILAIITFLLKTSVYLFQTDSKKEQTGSLQMKWFFALAKKVPGSESPIFHKEYKLLLNKGILSDFLKKIYAYILVTVITIGFQILSGKSLTFDINLVYLILTGEAVAFGLTFSKIGLGYEKKYIIIYTMSGYSLSELILLKAKLMSMLTFMMMLPIHLCLSVIFRLNWLESISLIPLYGSFILLFSYAASYFYSYKPSFENDFALLNKYAAVKPIFTASAILYVTISYMFIINALVEKPLSVLLIMITGTLIHLAICLVFVNRIRNGNKNFYGEYAKSVF